MPMNRTLPWLTCLAVCLPTLSLLGMELMESGQTGELARVLLAQAVAVEKKEWEGNPEEARGVMDETGKIVVIPRTTLMEDLRDPAVMTEEGALLGGLFLSRGFSPLVEGKAIESDRLPVIPLKGVDGADEELLYLRLTVRHLGEGEWRLLVFGADEKPLFDSPFAASPEPGEGKMDVRVVEPDSEHRRLIVRVFGKYESGFTIAD